MNHSYGFIITRHVNSEKTNKYWNISVRCIRKFYPYIKIVIIDDNSNPLFLKSDYEYKNVEIIQSEYHGRGELLPYIYYNKNKWFDHAIILHDSIFIHKKLNIEKLIEYNHSVIPLWFFNPDKEDLQNTLRISNSLNNSYILQKKILMNDTILGLPYLKWYGCFGAQCFIKHDFVKHIENKYKISNMINFIKCRRDRCSFERIIGAIFFTEYQKLYMMKSLFGNIFTYQKWCYSYENYENDIKNGKLPNYIVKVWSGR
jgi:hypothetical protein